MYLYEIPYGVISKLYKVLDVGDRLWKNLAGELGYSVLEIQFLELEYNRPQGSPTERLLIKWGQSNATVDMLASKLKNINAIRALDVIEHLVSESLRSSLFEDERNNELVVNVAAVRVPMGAPQMSDDCLPSPGSYQVQVNNGGNGCYKNKTMASISKDMNYKRTSSSYNALYKATEGFSDENVLSKNAERTVYKGNLNGSLVAIKFFRKLECSQLTQLFYNELEIVKRMKHQNVLNYIDVATDGPCLCLALPYMENSSLRDQLDCKANTVPLTWIQRHKILLEASCGLLHMHSLTPRPFVHGNLKSTNILLGANMEAKLSDFGLIYEVGVTKTTNHCTNVSMNLGKGSQLTTLKAYMPDEYFVNGFQSSLKTDIHCFGVIIFETCTKKLPFDEKRGREECFLTKYIQNIFETKNNKLLVLKDATAFNWLDDLWIKLMSLGKMCTLDRKNDRPSTSVVCNSLKLYLNGALNFVAPVDKKSYEDEPVKDTEKANKTVCVTSYDTDDLIQFISNLKTTEISKMPNENKNADIYSSNCNDLQLVEKPSHTKNFDSDIWLETSKRDNNCTSNDIKRLKNKNLLGSLMCLHSKEESDLLKANNDNFKVNNESIKGIDESMESKELSCSLKSSEIDSSCSSKDDSPFDIKLLKTIDVNSLTKLLKSDSSDFVQLSKMLEDKDQERFSRLQKLKENFQSNC